MNTFFNYSNFTQANLNGGDLAKRLKHSDSLLFEIQKKYEDLNAQAANNAGESQRLQAENARLKVTSVECFKLYLLKLKFACRQPSKTLKTSWMPLSEKTRNFRVRFHP